MKNTLSRRICALGSGAVFAPLLFMAVSPLARALPTAEELAAAPGRQSAPLPDEAATINEALKALIAKEDPAAKSILSNYPAFSPIPTPAIDDKALYPFTEDSLAHDGVPHGTIDGPNFFGGEVFPNTVRGYYVYVPAQYDASKPAPFLIFLDGGHALNDNWRIPNVLDNLIAKKEIPVMLGIFISPGEIGGAPPELMMKTGNPDPNDRSIEYDSLGDAFSRLIINEILPEIAKKYNLTKDPEGHAIFGYSSGGIAAFNVAWERPDVFRKVGTAFGSFTNIRGGGAFPRMVEQADHKPIRVFLEDTLHDNPSPNIGDWHQANIAMLAALTDKNYDVFHVFAEGTHSQAHMARIFPDMLRWLFRDYPKDGSAPASASAAPAAP